MTSTKHSKQGVDPNPDAKIPGGFEIGQTVTTPDLFGGPDDIIAFEVVGRALVGRAHVAVRNLSSGGMHYVHNHNLTKR